MASLNAGCVEHLSKPVKRDILLHALEQHLALKWRYTQPLKTEFRSAIDNPPLNIEQRTQLLSLLENGEIVKVTEYLDQLAHQKPPPSDITTLLEFA